MAFVDTATGAGDRCLCRLPVSGKGQGQGTSLPTEATQWSPEYVHTDRVRSTEQCHLTCGDLILCEGVNIEILCDVRLHLLLPWLRMPSTGLCRTINRVDGYVCTLVVRFYVVATIYNTIIS